ncbi:RT0821/Lpp0805 family surface protein [Roseibium sp.]|uniref:RT0821/Lpp0805 family surface protein n=1 Tax=Roseibium sp. TaxID=1936156 RepID=UPI003A9724B4
MRLAELTCLLVLGAALSGCSAVSGGTSGAWNNQFGASSGSVAEDEASTAIAVLLDNDFGQALEASDHRAVAEAQKRALRANGVGVAVAWQNEKTGRSGQVQPGPVYQVNDTACREFTHVMVLDGHSLSSRGTACRQDDGSWKTLG